MAEPRSAVPARPPLQTDADIAAIVYAFYRDIESDPVLGPYFRGVDWDAHLPKMVAFWSSVVFHTGQYHGRPFDAHAALPALGAAHFDRWLARFHATVDAHASGEAAVRMKEKATQIAGIFRMKLGLWPVLSDAATS